MTNLILPSTDNLIFPAQPTLVSQQDMYAKFTIKLFAQSVENKLRSKELLLSKETACFNNAFKLMFIIFKEIEDLIFVDFIKIIIINLFN